MSQDLETFLDYLYEDGNGFVYSPTKPDVNDKDSWNQNFFKWPEERNELIAHIKSSAVSMDVYIGPALFSDRNAHREYVQSSLTYWCEFDGVIPTDLQGIPEPTLKVMSSESGREHWYWKSENLITDIKNLEDVNRGIAYRLGSDTSGWDCNQVLRPPQTVNYKRNKPVSLIGQSSYRLHSSAFDIVPRIPVVTSDLKPEDIPDVSDVVALNKWTKNTWELFRKKDFPVGQRSTALMNLSYACAEMGMSNGEIFSILRNADDRWGKFKGRQDRDIRLSGLINTARIKYPSESIEQNDFRVLGLKSLLETEVNIEWLIPECLEKQGSMLLTGPSGVGKTQLSLRFAMNLALGKSFLGYQITDPSKVLFFSLEMGILPLKYFLQQMSQNLSKEELDTLEKNLLFIPLGESFPLDTEKGQQKVEDCLAKHKPIGFFWDSLGSATDSALGEEKTKVLASWTERVRNRYGCFTWFIHHNRKANGDNKKPNTQADIYGSVYIVNRATTIFCLWPLGDEIELITIKKRLGIKDAPFTIIRTADLDFYRKPVIAPFKGEIREKITSGPQSVFEQNQPITPEILGI